MKTHFVGTYPTLNANARCLNTIFLRVGVIVSISVAASGALTAGPALANDSWNPAPADGDVIYSLPCDQKIVFRKVVTQELANGNDNLLEDRRVRLGSSDVQKAYIDYLRTGFIAGHFVKNNTRFYLLGKYETTVAQYKSVTTAGSCDISDEDKDMPTSRVSWYDAVDFGRRLTGYLLKNDHDSLVSSVGTTSVAARLPTEIEWEFAARGGLSVSTADFQSDRAPMTEDLKAYAWFNDPLSSQGQLNPIGQLKPNPLGLYDVYGNVAEMMLEPFTLNKAGRGHGLSGGVILRGGSFQTNSTYVTSSAREEDSLFDKDTSEEKRRRTTGFRIALAGLALPSTAEVNKLADEWNASSESLLPAIDNPMTLIAKLRDANSDLQLSKDLGAIEQSVRSELAENAEKRRQLLSGLLINVGKNISDIRSRYTSVNNRAKLIGQGILSAQDVQTLGVQIRADQAFIQEQNYFAQDTLVRIVGNYQDAELDEQSKITAAELKQRSLDNVAEGVLIASVVAREMHKPGRQYNREQVLSLIISGL